MKSLHPGKFLTGVLAWLVLGSLHAALGQNQTAKSSAKESQRAAAAQQKPADKDGKELKLLDATRVSTDATVNSAAQDEARKKDPESAKTPGSSSAVMEFQPASAPPGGEALVVPDKDSKKAKKVHGDAYGVLGANDPRTHTAGGSVGTTTKNKKTSVYVEANTSSTDQRH
jgi:hypothetical protein